ncbi:uncharacterized protein LOC131931223 [Physella acuta]|uniref:uncharacterized protein LOC131931223 n=1 Tax=Physella acuta TaxID=109671 RepID=UPI0027DCBCEC|nr:uncharacterized protein LOC131931223 [Physella acuta]XP_059143935.1 uncharacterized protein LOC131931223 [Physella acuta]
MNSHVMPLTLISLFCIFGVLASDGTEKPMQLDMKIEGYEKECDAANNCVYTGRIYGRVAGYSNTSKCCYGIFLKHCYKNLDCSNYRSNWQNECFFGGNCMHSACKQMSNDDHCYCEDKSYPFRFRFRPEFKNSWYILAALSFYPRIHTNPYNFSERFDVSNPPVELRNDAFLASTNGKLQLQAEPVIMFMGALYALIMSLEMTIKDII